MAELNPLFVNIDNVYGPDELGLPYRDLIGEGIVESTDLEVTQNGGGNMSVNVAAGACWVRGDHMPDVQPTYRCYNDATVNLGISAADATNDRLDIVVAEVLDDLFSGTSKEWRLRVVEGTPAASPSEPALPLSAIKLATIAVGAGVSSILTADITDTRPRARVGGGVAAGLEIVSASVNVPNVAAGAGGSVNVTVPGLRVGDICFRLGKAGNEGRALIFDVETPVCTTADTIVLAYFNATSGSSDPAAITHYFGIIRAANAS